MLKNIHIISPPLQNNTGVLPAAYLNFKTYYECLGQYSDACYWPRPPMYKFSFNTFMDHLRKYPPTVLALGIFIWSSDLCYKIALAVREEWPDCVIVGGGPQPAYLYDQGYFIKHPEIDVIVPYDGEDPLLDIIDQTIAGTLDYNTCANVVYPTPFGWQKSDKQIASIKFKWPKPPILAQKEIIAEYVAEYKEQGARIDVFLDTTRGCPYGCTFCDWGGSGQTKIRKKSMEAVRQEARILVDLEVDFVHIIDANFGILPRDVDIANMYVALNKETGYPKTLFVLFAKNNKDRVTEIHEILFDAGLTIGYHAAIQDFSEVVRDNVVRRDIGLVDHLKSFHTATNSDKHHFELGTILGLPGQTVDSIMSNIDEIAGHNVMYPQYHTFQFLPNSPAAAPEYMSKWQMKTKKMLPIASPVAVKIKDCGTDFGDATVVTEATGYSAEIVVSTSSFTSSDLVIMRSFTGLMSGGYSSGMFRIIAHGLKKYKGVSYSEFFKRLYYEFFAKGDKAHNNIRSILEAGLETAFTTSKPTRIEFDQTDLPDEFPFLLPSNVFWRISLLWNSDEIYDDLITWLDAIGWMDDTILDIIEFNKNMMITPDYNPKKGRTWTNEYDWLTWYNTISKNSIEIVTLGEPTKGKITYNTTESTTTSGNHVMPIEWHTMTTEIDILMDYFYKTSFGTKSEVFLREVIEQK